MWFRYPLFCHLLVQIFCFWIVKSQNVTIYCDISTTTSNNNGSLEAPYQTFDDAFIAAADLANSIGILPDSVIQIKLAPGLYNLDESMGGFYAWDGGSSQTASLRISGQNSTISFTEDFLTVGRGPAFEIGFSGSLIFERITFKSAPGQTEWFFATTTADAKLAFDDIFVEGTDVAAYSQTYFVLSNDGGSIALNNAEFGHGACLKTHTVSFAAITSITNLRIVDREYASLFNEVTAGQLVFKNWHLRGLWLDSYSNFVVFATGENARADVANGLLEKHSSLPSDNLVEENTAFDSERLAEIYVTNVTFRDTSVCLVTALYAGNIYAKDITAIGVEKFIDLLFAYNARIELVGAHIENCTGSLNNQGPTAQVVMENVHFINLRNLESPFMYFKGQLGTFIFTFKNVTLEATVPITNPLYMIYLRGGRAQIDGLRLIGLYTCVDSCVHASKMLDFGIKNSLFSGLTLLGSQTLTIEAPPSHVLIDNWTVESIKNGGALVVRAYNTGANISIANSRFVKNKNNPFLVGVNSMAAASATLNIRNTTFAGNYYSRVISLCDGQIRFDNATFWNNTSEENGQVACDMSSGKNSLTILSSLFDGNKGVNGASMYIAGLVNASQVYLRGNVFKNNVALSRSGGWYSTVPSPLPIDLESIYINNTARSGADFSTAAAKLRLVANLSDISGYSGFALPTFSAQAVDIFGQWFYTTIADYAILLDVNVTRANNRSEAAALPGQTTSMIVFGTAEFSNVRILAPPGVYMVTVSHPADTAAIELEPVHIPVTVLPCAYPKRERSVSGYAASECHVPVCPRGCLSTGVCVDDGNCACTSTMYEGWDCSIKAAVNDSAIVTFAVTEQLTFSTSTRDRIFDTLQATFGETYNIIFRQFTQSRSDLMEFKYSLTNKRGEYLTATELSSMSTKAATSLMSSIPSSGEVVARLQTGDLSNTNLQQSVISLVIASIGITAVLLHSMWLYIKRNTGILKSTVMPLNYILNMGIAGMFAFPITDLLLPTRESCTAQVAFMPFSIGLAVPALAAKVIYYRSKYNNRIGVLKGPTTAESNFSTLIAGGLFTVYLVLAILWLSVDAPTTKLIYKSSSDTRYYTCGSSNGDDSSQLGFVVAFSGITAAQLIPMIYISLKMQSATIPARENLLLLANSVNLFVLGGALVGLLLSDFLSGIIQFIVRAIIVHLAAWILALSFLASKVVAVARSAKGEEENEMQDAIRDFAMSRPMTTGVGLTKGTALLGSTPLPGKPLSRKRFKSLVPWRTLYVQFWDHRLSMWPDGANKGSEYLLAKTTAELEMADGKGSVSDTVKVKELSGPECLLQFETHDAAKKWIEDFEVAKVKGAEMTANVPSVPTDPTNLE